MDFDALHAWVPYVNEGKPKSKAFHPYPGITLGMPGRHADQTRPAGGDFVVCVTDPTIGWAKHQFTHGDIFLDLEAKRAYSQVFADMLMEHYRRVVVEGFDPDKIDVVDYVGPGVDPNLFLRAVQALSVAEHRRYARYEPAFGGRFLPYRFGAGIAEGLWTAGHAIDKQKKGRPGVEWLERLYGVPYLTQTLMSAE